MPTPSFPPTLPLVSKFTVTPSDGVLTDEEDGVKDFRLRTLDRGARGSAEWTFIEDDLATFNTFRKEDLLNGHRQFCIQLPSAAGISCHIVRMLNTQIKPIGYGAYTVTCELEIRSRAFDICECPAPPALEIGWLNPHNSTSGVAAHENSGTAGPFSGFSSIYAGVVGYTGGTVVWNAVWTGSSPYSSPPSQDTVPGRPDLVRFYSFFSTGILTVTATVDGVPTGEAIEIARGFGDYPPISWGPASAIEDPALHRYWGIAISRTFFGGTMKTAEVELRNGAAVLTNLNVPMGTSDVPTSGFLGNLTNGSLSSSPVSYEGLTGFEEKFIYFDLGLPVLVNGAYVAKYDTDGEYPVYIKVLYSDNGTTWFTRTTLYVDEPITDFTFGGGTF